MVQKKGGIRYTVGLRSQNEGRNGKGDIYITALLRDVIILHWKVMMLRGSGWVDHSIYIS